MNSIIRTIKRYLLRFALIQLFLTLVSLPIQIAWGLPISLLSPVGNLIFNPFLTVFLFLSSLLFFCQLVCIPTGWIIWPLEQTTRWWLVLLDWHSKDVFIAFAQPAWWLLLLMPIGAVLLLTTRLYKTVVMRICMLSGFLLLIGLCMKFFIPSASPIHEIPCNNGVVTLIAHRKKLILIDPGVISRNASAASWATYDLPAEIIKRTGMLEIDTAIALRPGTRTWQAFAQLAEKIPIRKLYVPFFEGTLTRSQWYHFRAMEKSVRAQGGTLARITTKKVNLEQWCGLEPLDQRIAYQDITYQSARLVGEIDQKPFAIYATHHIHEQ